MPDFIIGTYQFDNYCYSDPGTGSIATINGSLNINTEGSTISFSTPTSLRIITSNPNEDFTIDVQGGILGLDSTGSISSVSIANLNISDNSTGTHYSASSINVVLGGSAVTFSANINDPEAGGNLHIEGTADNNTRQLNTTVTDSYGSVVSISGIGGVYDTSFNGSPLGTLDCSSVTVPSIPL